MTTTRVPTPTTGLADVDAWFAGLAPTARERLPAVLGGYLDTAATATARASFYNDRATQAAAVEAAHAALFAVDRGLYAVALLLPGAADHARQLGLLRLLAAPRQGPALLDAPGEQRALLALCRALPPTRLLKTFIALAGQRVNNARTRKLILSQVLGSPRLERWAVTYRRKLAVVLRHAWGRRTASIVRAALARPDAERDDRTRTFLRRQLARFADGRDVAVVEECVRFVLGDERALSRPQLVAYCSARSDLSAGRRLPFETLEGIRSTYHPQATTAAVLALTRAQLTAGQRIGLQRTAAAAGVEVAFDPTRHDAVRLYRYAFERGLDGLVAAALADKAAAAAARLPVALGRIAVIVDTSASMAGDATRALWPIAAALAVRDVLVAAADASVVVTADGRPAPAGSLVRPAGDTALGAVLVEALRARPDTVVVLSDGYENAPAGRFAEVLRLARGLGVTTPVVQLSPVLAAETGGVRALSDDAPVLPTGGPEALGLALLRGLLTTEPGRALRALLALAGDRLRLARGPDNEEVCS